MTYRISGHEIRSLLHAMTKWLPGCLPVYQLIRRHNYSNTWPAVTIYTDNDDVEKITTVLCSCGNYENSLTGRTYLFHSVDGEMLRLLLNDPGIIDWTSDRIQFDIMPMTNSQVVNEVMGQHGREIPEYQLKPDFLSGCQIYTLGDRDRMMTMAERPLPAGFKLGKLKREHNRLMQSKWSYPQPVLSLENYSNTIQRLPNLAIYNEKDEIVSWAVLRAFGDIGYTHTLSEFRGQGLASILTAKLAKRSLEDGNNPFVVIPNINKASIKMHEALGFTSQNTDNVHYYRFL